MSLNRTIALAGLFTVLAANAFAGTLSGTVKDPGGAPFQGAFVQAKNLTTKMTHSVLSDRQGRYRIPDLAPGRYDVQVRALGFQADPRKGMPIETAPVSDSLRAGSTPCQAGASNLEMVHLFLRGSSV